jgi:CTP synthase (UTP-ammonia lyase)
MPEPVRIAILGDFNPEFPAHHATNASIQHAAAHLGFAAKSEWVATPRLTRASAALQLAGYHGLWASPGSPYKSQSGMFAGIEFARTRDWPFVGT